ncbi:hypothetical protein GCM10023238_33550 [Streptomyces heliomycini]
MPGVSSTTRRDPHPVPQVERTRVMIRYLQDQRGHGAYNPYQKVFAVGFDGELVAGGDLVQNVRKTAAYVS